MTVFYYEITVFDENFDNVAQQEVGLVYGENYTEAMEKIEDYTTAPNGTSILCSVDKLYEIENANGLVDNYTLKELFNKE